MIPYKSTVETKYLVGANHFGTRSSVRRVHPGQRQALFNAKQQRAWPFGGSPLCTQPDGKSLANEEPIQRQFAAGRIGPDQQETKLVLA